VNSAGIQLTLLAGPVVPIPAPRPIVEALDSVEVTSSAGSRSGFQLQFKVSNRSPLHTLLLVAGNQVPWLRVVIVVTLGGMPHVLADGVVTRQELGSADEAGESTLTVTGEDLTAVMDQQEFNGLPYPAMPVETRVLVILAKYALFGMIPLVVPSLFTDVPIPTSRIPTHRGTDLAYINELAREAGYVFYVEPGPVPGTNTAYWGPEIRVGVPQPALNIGMDAHSNVESLQFSIAQTDATLPVVFIQNPIAKFPIPLPVPSIDLLKPPLGLIPPGIKKIELLKDTAKDSPMTALSKGLARAAGSQDAVRGEGSLDMLRYGRVLKARQLVGVRGAGLAFDGLYYVNRVTSRIRRGEFRQSFSLVRNGLVSTVPGVPA
jgi:hypothetical protein